MNKKIICLFIVFLVACLTISNVSATNLVEKNMDGYFSIKVPKGADFEVENGSVTENGIEMTSIGYISDNLGIVYMDVPLLNENVTPIFLQSLFEEVYPDSTEYYESQEGNLTILEPITMDSEHLPMVGVSSGNKTIILMGDDLNLLKEMAYSVKFIN